MSERQYTIAVIDPFAGSISAEHEVILRMKRGAENAGIHLIPCDTWGHILDDNLEPTNEFIDESALDFAISTHYDSHKTLDTFYYHTLWNPPEIPLNLGDYDGRVSDNYVMNDDYLIFDSGVLSDHLRSILIRKPRTLEGASFFSTSFPADAVMEPNLQNPKMFYCGMNWEKVVHNSNRHEGLFKLLDKTGKVSFFGPDMIESWGGLRPWEGYECYQHPIPFDGFSIVEEINNCGICLVLSSNAHRRAGVATTRLYEACAAGAVIISDENEFVRKNFNDAALFINYNKDDPKDTFNQIMECYDWICTHLEKSFIIAQRAQQIFLERFSFEKQFRQILDNHENRKAQIAKDVFAKSTSKRVLVTYVLDTLDETGGIRRIKRVMKNICHQVYPNIHLAIAVDHMVFDSIVQKCKGYEDLLSLIPMTLFDACGCRIMTDGQAIRALQKRIPHDYYINTMRTETWFYDHITTLVRTIEDSGGLCAYSGSLSEDIQGFRRSYIFGQVGEREIFDEMEKSLFFPSPGQFLFATEADEYVPDYLFTCVDGKEHYLYLNILYYQFRGKIAFSERMTLKTNLTFVEDKMKVIDDARQARFIRGLVHPYRGCDVYPMRYAKSADELGASLGVYIDDDQKTEKGDFLSSKVGDMNRMMLIWFPIKLWMRIRLCCFILRFLRKDSRPYKTLYDHYNQLVNEFLGN